MTEDVARPHKSVFYANMEYTFNGFDTPTKICAFSKHFIIFLLHLLHLPIIQWKLYQNVFVGLIYLPKFN